MPVSISNVLDLTVLKKPWFYRNLAAEFLGTFFLVSIQCAVVLSFGNTDTWQGLVQVGLAMGFIIICIIEMFGHFSGGHFNPAVTCAMMVARAIDPLKGVCYILSQFVAGILAGYFVKGITPKHLRESLSVTVVHDDIDTGVGMVIEAWLTAVLVFTIFGATDKARKSVVMPSIPIGLAVALDIMAAGAYTGASMNPARSFGPALAMEIWEDHWVYWVGPILGGVVASIIYNYVLVLPAEDNQEKTQDVDIDNTQGHQGKSQV